jgi:hypothetical protein
MRWSLRQVIGYWLWWRNHRLVAEDSGRAPMDFPEYLQWVRFDYKHNVEKGERAQTAVRP